MRVGNQNLQIPEAMSDAGFVLQLLTRGVGDTDDIDQQRVVGAAGTRVFDRNKAMDAVPFADENQRQALMDSGRSIDTDVDGVTVVGYSPTLGPKRCGKSQDAR